MDINTYEVLVAKEYEIKIEGRPVKRTAWNRVGRAWHSRSQDSLCFELFLLPNQRHVIQFRKSQQEPPTPTDEASF